MVRNILAVLVAGVVGMGCGSVCSHYDTAMHRCGGAFDRTRCEQNISKCTASELKIIDSAATCAEDDTVCKDGTTVDLGKRIACSAPLLNLTEECRTAL